MEKISANYILFLAFWLFNGSLWAQQPARWVEIRPIINGQSLVLEQNYLIPSLQDSAKIENLRFYISHIAFYRGHKRVYTLKKKHHLIDAAQPNSLKIGFDCKKKYDKVKFLLGVDSLTNVSGAQSGDLDPTLGMYWTWQSGYIHFKLEGHSPACKSRQHIFQYHIGGYQQPNNSLQTVELAVDASRVWRIDVDLSRFFELVDPRQVNEIMNPNPQATAIAKKISGLFSCSYD